MPTAENVHGFGIAGLPVSESYDTRINGKSIAAHFDRLVKDTRTSPFNEYFDETLLDLLSRLEIPQDFTMLDIGCGNGKTLARISRDFTPRPGKLMGFDVSREMVSIAGSNYPFLEISGGDMRNILPERDKIADVITSVNTIHYLPTLKDVAETYDTAFRLLKPGGWYILVTGDQASTSRWRDMSLDQFHEWIADGRKPMDWSMPDSEGRPVFRMQFYPYLNEEHKSALETAGFNPVKEYRQYPPSQNIAELNKNVYELLSQDPIFVFFVAQKPSRWNV